MIKNVYEVTYHPEVEMTLKISPSGRLRATSQKRCNFLHVFPEARPLGSFDFLVELRICDKGTERAEEIADPLSEYQKTAPNQFSPFGIQTKSVFAQQFSLLIKRIFN